MSDTFDLILNSPLTQEDFNLITDAEFEHSDTIWFDTPKGKRVEFRKVVKGEWILHQDSRTWECSVCGAFDVLWRNFCHNCGADMRGGTNERE